MHPVLFSFRGITFYSYGLMVGLGYVLGVIVSARRGEKRGINPDSLVTAFILMLAGGVVAGRILYVLLNRWLYPDLISVLDLREGGLSMHGVLVGGIAVLFAYSRKKKLPLGLLLDVVAPGVALGQAVGRIGCLLTGCCYGIPTSGPLGVYTRFAPGLRHPYQLYESLADFGLFLALIWAEGKFAGIRAVEGGLFLAYLSGYSVLRFFLEFLRDNESYFLGLSYGQWTCIVFVALSAAVYRFLYLRADRRRGL